MWPDLRKPTFHEHNSKTHFSPSNDSCTHYLTIQAGIGAKVAQAAFAVACLWGFIDIQKCSGSLQMAPSLFDKQTASYDSPHDWLMNLPMDLAALCDMWR